MIYANGVHLSVVLENTALVYVLYFSIRHENEHRLYFPTRLLVYGISLTYGPPCALCEEIMKFGTDDL